MIKPLKTAELAVDAHARLKVLATQAPLSANSVFSNYKSRNVSLWSNGWTRRIDLTGVSWSQKQSGTAITPRHIVFAAHYKMKTGSVIRFHDRDGQPHRRTVQDLISFRNRDDAARADIAVALLDEPLPSGVKSYRLLPPRNDYGQTLPGCPVLVTEQKRRVFIHQVNRQVGSSIFFHQHPDFPASLYKYLVMGDSGNPSFLLVGGEPVLIQTHTGGGSGAGPFYSEPSIFAALQAAVAKLDPSYQIRTVPLDPASSSFTR